MINRGTGSRKVVKHIKTNCNVFFSKNFRITKKLNTAMNELNNYNSSPERRIDDDDNDDDNNNDDNEDEDDDEEHSVDRSGEKTESLKRFSPSPEVPPFHRKNIEPTAAEVRPKNGTRTQEDVCHFAERCMYIPMRLTVDERRLLNVLENALEVCEYTDTVDVTYSHTGKSKHSRIVASLVDILSIASGLLMANNLTKGETLLSGKSLTENIPLFADMFEIGRRYKIMNPGKMRNTYGKLMWILMDTESNIIKGDLKMNFVKPVLTVGRFLKTKECRDFLTDPLLLEATRAVNDVSGEKSKEELQEELEIKSSNTQKIIKRYTSAVFSEQDIQRILDSISDQEAYLSFNVLPVEKAIQVLKETFNPQRPEEHYSLELKAKPRKDFLSFGGFSSRYINNSACLSHNHATQYTFVLQSLTLWKEIMWNLPKLWLYADQDLIGEQYRLVDTGQGYHRLQSCPTVGSEMRRILSHTQRKCGSPWVGLSVIHLGDRDVPNALVFIDKYTQVPRILAPITKCISRLPALAQDRAFHKYVIDEWGSISGLKMQILSDFFKHGFDGSGDDGGSCIDGRLTSAWNWCSKLHKKPYYNVFMYTGFQGFDGDWKED